MDIIEIFVLKIRNDGNLKWDIYTDSCSVKLQPRSDQLLIKDNGTLNRVDLRMYQWAMLFATELFTC